MTTNRAPIIRLIFLLCAVSLGTARAQSQTCSIEQSNVQTGFPAQGGDVKVQVTTSDPACELKIIRSDTWFTTSLSRTGPTVWSVTLSAGPAGIGATYGVYFNCCGTFYYNRVGSLDFNYKGYSAPFTFGSINVLQEGFPDCTFSIDPTVKTFGPDDGKGGAQNGAVQVTAKSNSAVPVSSCIWQASTAATWITLAAPSSAGNGTLAYTVAPNPGPARKGVIQVAGKPVQVNQLPDPVEFVGMEVDANGSESVQRSSSFRRKTDIHPRICTPPGKRSAKFLPEDHRDWPKRYYGCWTIESRCADPAVD